MLIYKGTRITFIYLQGQIDPFYCLSLRQLPENFGCPECSTIISFSRSQLPRFRNKDGAIGTAATAEMRMLRTNNNRSNKYLRHLGTR